MNEVPLLLQNLTYSFTVLATDSGAPESLQGSAQVIITVFSPDNFFPPELDSAQYTGSVAEGISAGATVVSFTVTDNDLQGPASEAAGVFLFGADGELFEAVLTGVKKGVIRTK